MVNDNPVVALEEGTLLKIDGNSIRVKGTGIVKVFEKNKKAKELKSGSSLSFLL